MEEDGEKDMEIKKREGKCKRKGKGKVGCDREMLGYGRGGGEGCECGLWRKGGRRLGWRHREKKSKVEGDGEGKGIV